MYVKLPTPQWFVLESFHRISGCSNIIIGDHNKTTMLASCIESTDISIVLHIEIQLSIKNNAQVKIHVRHKLKHQQKQRKRHLKEGPQLRVFNVAIYISDKQCPGRVFTRWVFISY